MRTSGLLAVMGGSFFTCGHNTLNIPAISILQRALRGFVLLAVANIAFAAEPVYIPSKEEIAAGDVEIVAGEDRTIFEYRVNGRLMMIKIVPKMGATYYMVPADGEPHYDDLAEKKKLYPQWVIVEF